MIIVEGPDGAGKTTLCSQLADRFSIEIHNPGPRENLIDLDPRRSMTAIIEEIFGDDEPLIYDRLFFSELVYGPILRGSCNFTPYHEQYVKNLLQVMEVPIIFCIPNSEVIKKNLTVHDHIEGVQENIAKLEVAYRNELDELCEWPNVFLYDYTKLNSFDSYGSRHYDPNLQIEKYLQEREDRTL